VLGYAFARAAKKCRFQVVRAAAVSMMQQIAGQLAQPRADPNCNMIHGKATWIGTGRTWQERGAIMKTRTGSNSMNTLGPALEVLLEMLETDDRIMLAVEPMSADIANMVSHIFFCKRLSRSLNLIVLFPVTFLHRLFAWNCLPA
jgi:hypothetical protein